MIRDELQQEQARVIAQLQADYDRLSAELLILEALRERVEVLFSLTNSEWNRVNHKLAWQKLGAHFTPDPSTPVQ